MAIEAAYVGEVGRARAARALASSGDDRAGNPSIRGSQMGKRGREEGMGRGVTYQANVSQAQRRC